MNESEQLQRQKVYKQTLLVLLIWILFFYKYYRGRYLLVIFRLV